MKNCQKFGSLVFQTLMVNIENGNFLYPVRCFLFVCFCFLFCFCFCFFVFVFFVFCLFTKLFTRGGVCSLTGRFRGREASGYLSLIDWSESNGLIDGFSVSKSVSMLNWMTTPITDPRGT